jgi:4-amino-4-deoxy-L-arabinose transferase-like glycosyltransferase
VKREHSALILAAVLFLWFLWGHDLWAPDEPYYGEGAREMLVDGQWLVPHVNGVVSTIKPPLFFWLIAVFSIPFGQVLEFTARLPSALAALGAVALTIRLGRRWFGARTAALSGVFLATSYLFWDKARFCQIEALLCLLVWVSLSAFLAFREGEADGRKAGIVFYAAAAVSVLAKWPIGLVIPLAIVVVTLVLDRTPGRILRFAPLAGPAVFVLITGVWVWAVALWGPEGYSVWTSLKEDFLVRGLHGVHHVRPPWYYLTTIPTTLLPWTGLLPGALVLAWHRRREPGDRFLLIVALVVVSLFSLSTEKRDYYVLPAFPAFALMIGNLVGTVSRWNDAGDSGRAGQRWVTVGQGVIGAAFLALGCALPIVGLRFDEVPYWTALAATVIVAGLGISTLWFAARGRPLQSVLATVVGITGLYLFASAVILPMLDPVKSAREFAVQLADVTAESRQAGHDVVAWRTGNLPRAFAFYGNGLYTVDTQDPAVLVRHLRSPDQVYAVVLATDLGDLDDGTRRSMFVIDRARLSRRDLLLVSNTPALGATPLEFGNRAD